MTASADPSRLRPAGDHQAVPVQNPSPAVVLAGVALFAACAALLGWLPVPQRLQLEGAGATQVSVGLLIAGAMLAADAFELVLPLGGRTIRLTCAEVPLLLGLLLLPAGEVVGIRYGIGLVLVVLGLSPRWDLSWLAVRRVAESTAAAAVLALAPGAPGTLGGWGAAVLGAVAAVMVRLALDLARFRQASARRFDVESPDLVHGFPAQVGAGVAAASFAFVVLASASHAGPDGVVVLRSSFGGPVVICTSYLLVSNAVMWLQLRRSRRVGAFHAFLLDAGAVSTSGQLEMLVATHGEQLFDGADVTFLPLGSSAEEAALGTRPAVVLGATTTDTAGRRALAVGHRSHMVLATVPGPSGPLGTLAAATRGDATVPVSMRTTTLASAFAHEVGRVLADVRRWEHLRADARRDGLTGCLNRSGLLERIAVEVATEVPAAVLLLDLDRFRAVNDTLGTPVGDRLLTMVGSRLIAAAPPEAAVARLAGDEFVVLLPAADAPTAQRLAQRLVTEVQRSFTIDGLGMDVSCAVGISMTPDHARTAEALLRQASLAVAGAKALKHPWRMYDITLDHSSQRRLALVGELARALELGQLVVWYQPQIAFADNSVVGVEALVRWDHPERGIVPPDEFIGVAEGSGLIAAVTSFVLATSLAQIRAWSDSGLDLTLSVNVSMRGLHDPNFPKQVETALRTAGVPASQLLLEITESSVMTQPEHTLPVLSKLAAMGVRLSVDDFGTGYSSLAYLRRFPIHEVKIDKSFVLSMSTDDNDAAIVRAVIDLAGSLGLQVVAEGVEDEITRGRLSDLRCDIGQGYLFTRPLPPDRLGAWFSARTVATTPVGSGRVVRIVPPLAVAAAVGTLPGTRPQAV